MVTTLQGVSITQLIEQQVAQCPDAIAIICRETQTTYEELNRKANQLARYLRSLGVKPETPVGICVDRSLEMFVGLLGILKAGGAYVPIDPSYPKDRLEFILVDSQLPILLTQTHLLRDLPRLEQVKPVCMDMDWQHIAETSSENFDSGVTSDNLAYIIYTSGSTGQPKGVQITHRAVVNLLYSLQCKPGLTEADTLLAITTISFDMAVPDLFLPLITGARIKLLRRDVTTDAAQLAKALSDPDITFVQATPATWRLVLAAGWPGNRRLKMLCGGETLTRSLANQLLEKGESLWHMYGPTETTVWSMVHKVKPGIDTIPLGHPIAKTQIYLIESPARRKDDPLKLVPVGTSGEVYIGGDGVARGYLNRSELNNERFIPDPFQAGSEARLYKTGDLARYLPDGNIEFIGRIDHQVKIRGFRVETGDIEAAISQHPSIRDAVIIAKEDGSGSKRLVAYVVPKDLGSGIEPSELIEQAYKEQIQQWQNVWSETYSQSVGQSFNNDPIFNSSGWNNSFTGLPMPVEEVREWVDCTVERILTLRPKRVLEIGCGMGLLLFRIAPQCTHYFGTDISAEAITHIRQQLNKTDQDWSHLTVCQGAAHELERFEPRTFDTVVINSVVQYFPSVDYLVQVLEKIVELVKPGGRIFIGDVRNLQLLEAFHTGIQLNHAQASLSISKFRHKIRERVTQDRELVLCPKFFLALKKHIPRITQVQTQLKQGSSNNELIRFRFDVVLDIEVPSFPSIESDLLDWQQQQLSILGLRQLLQEQQPAMLKITNVPDSRVLLEVKASELLAGNHDLDNLKTVKNLWDALPQASMTSGVHPEIFWRLSQELPYNTHITLSEEGTTGCYDVVLRHIAATTQEYLLPLSKQTVESKSWSIYANSPLQTNAKNSFVPRLRAFLKNKLPDYMIPSAFVVMEKLPLTPNGKIDRRSLPEPKKERPTLSGAFVAASNDLETQITEIWSQILGIEQIGIYDNFFELGGHSLLAAQLLAQVKETLQVELPLFYLLRKPTVAGLIKSIEVVQGLNLQVHQPEETDSTCCYADSILAPEIQIQEPFVEVAEPQKILLTGATGFLGAFLLQELLQQTQAELYCLVRASHLEEGRQKIITNLERYMLWSNELSSRIIPVLGDLSQPLLGLTKDRFQALANKLDRIYHCGAFVNLIYPYTALRSTNVLGTQEILRLACLGKTTPVHFISTIDVFQSPAYFDLDILRENEPLNYGQDLDKGYAQTKWVAEHLIREAYLRGLPICIYRPGMLTGHSQTGSTQTNDLMSRIIKGMIQLGIAPELKYWVNMTPVDFASKALVHLSSQPESFGKTFHIVNPQALPWEKLIDQIRSFGYDMRSIPHEEWKTELLKLDKFTDNALSPMLSLFTEQHPKTQKTYLETFLLTAKSFDCQNTLEGLSKTPIACPSIDTKLLNVYLSYFQKVGFLEPDNRIKVFGNPSTEQQENYRNYISNDTGQTSHPSNPVKIFTGNG